MIVVFCIKAGCHPNVTASRLAKMQGRSRRVAVGDGGALLSGEARRKPHEKREHLCVESSSECISEHKLHLQRGKLQTYPWARSERSELKPSCQSLPWDQGAQGVHCQGGKCQSLESTSPPKRICLNCKDCPFPSSHFIS